MIHLIIAHRDSRANYLMEYSPQISSLFALKTGWKDLQLLAKKIVLAQTGKSIYRAPHLILSDSNDLQRWHLIKGRAIANPASKYFNTFNNAWLKPHLRKNFIGNAIQKRHLYTQCIVRIAQYICENHISGILFRLVIHVQRFSGWRVKLRRPGRGRTGVPLSGGKEITIEVTWKRITFCRL